MIIITDLGMESFAMVNLRGVKSYYFDGAKNSTTQFYSTNCIIESTGIGPVLFNLVYKIFS